jgi:hypothetical protein
VVHRVVEFNLGKVTGEKRKFEEGGREVVNGMVKQRGEIQHSEGGWEVVKISVKPFCGEAGERGERWR